MLPQARDYDTLYREFRWQVPAQYNIGLDVCDRWANADPGRLAILHVRPDGSAQPVSYGWLKDTSNRLANALAAHGVARGDRVALLLPQTPEVAAIHIAVYKLAAIALPLALLFGTEAISYRLQNSGAKAVITNAQGLAKLAAIRAEVPIGLLLSIDGAADGALGFHETLARASPDFAAQATSGRRPGDDGLYVGNDRPAQGRSARPPRAARAPARDRDPPRVLPATGRPHLDAGRLGMGRWASQCSAAGPALRRAGGGAPVRTLRSRGGLRGHGAL